MQILCPSPNAITKLSTECFFFPLSLALHSHSLRFASSGVRQPRNVCICLSRCWCSCILIVVYIFCHCHRHTHIHTHRTEMPLLLLWCFFIAFWLHIRHKWWFVVNLHKRINQNGTYTSRSVNWQNMLWENGKMYDAVCDIFGKVPMWLLCGTLVIFAYQNGNKNAIFWHFYVRFIMVY